MNTIFVMIFLNLFLMFSRWNVAASENEDSFEIRKQQTIGYNPSDDVVTEYYEDGEFEGFVKEQFCLKENEEPFRLNRYEYKTDEITVIDAFDNKTVYKENEQHELSTIEKYDSVGVLISKERFFLEGSKLVSKQLEDDSGKVLVCERYIYSPNGELLEKKIYSDIYDLSQKIENEVLAVDEMFTYLNDLLSGVGYESLQKLVESYFDPLYLVMAGYYNHPLETGVFGFGEVSDKVRITFINGILNRTRDCMETSHLISKTHGGVNIHYIYRQTTGWANDLMGAVPARFGSLTPQAILLASTWKELIAEMGGVNSGGIIIHYAHSIGASDTWNARTLLTPQEKSMIRVVTIGSPFMIHEDGLHSVINYVSIRDGVSILDPFGYFRGHYYEDSCVHFLGNWRDGWPLVDHPICGSTYEALLYKLGSDFVTTYGSIR
jgi:hypothetical protein